jgi:tetratricopeptide (TPR) repeat protein
MELQGVDTRQPLLYGYFFYDKDTSHLKSLEFALLHDAYKLVRLDAVSDTEYILHVEKVEVHTPQSLEVRERQLRSIATQYKVRLYDGWDVGNIDPKKPLITEEQFTTAVNHLHEPELFELASDLYDYQDFKKAGRLFEMCIENKYKLDTCYFKFGVCLAEQDEFLKAIEMYERCISINPEYKKAHYNIGVVCYDNMMFEKSLRAYQKASQIDPTDDTIYYGIAADQFALGQYEEARTNCTKALSLNPKNEAARILLARIP